MNSGLVNKNMKC